MYSLSFTWILSVLKATGIRTIAPRTILIPLKVNAPMLSVDTLWATKLRPQMNDVKSNRRTAFLSFMPSIVDL